MVRNATWGTYSPTPQATTEANGAGPPAVRPRAARAAPANPATVRANAAAGAARFSRNQYVAPQGAVTATATTVSDCA